MRRREFIAGVGATIGWPFAALAQWAMQAISLAPFAGTARAQGFPSRSIHIIVGFPPGGGSDLLARLIGAWLSQQLGHPVIVENRPGAATDTATKAVVRAAPAFNYPQFEPQ